MAQLRTEGISRAAVLLELRETRIGEIDTPAPQPTETSAQVAGTLAERPTDVADGLQALAAAQ